MDALTAFFHMGGYAAFVWPAYGLAAVVMVGLLLASRRAWRANLAAVERLQSQSGRRRRPEPKPMAEATAP